jgi:hypothetical protein
MIILIIEKSYFYRLETHAVNSSNLSNVFLMTKKFKETICRGRGNAESFLAKKSAILAHSAIWGTLFVLGAYIPLLHFA